MNSEELKKFDPEIFDAVTREIERERNTIVLIASENYASHSVLQAQGSIFTNKYAEGYPGKRYYGGCKYADMVENLAIERAKELFGAEHVNVQPHSGTQANMAVFFSFLKPGDKILGMSLSHGGHLSHGAPINFSGIFYKSFFYGVDKKSGFIDYEDVRKRAKKHKPKMILAGASSYSRIIDFKILSDIAKEVNAYLLADIAHIAGLVTTGLHPSPVPYADFVTTTTHKTLKGPRGGMILCKTEYAKAIDRMVFPGIQGGPLVHVIAAKAVALKEALSKRFEEYQIQVIKNAKELADALKNKGFKLISDGTDIHLMLLDLTNKKITGKEAERILDLAGITVNKNSIPYDERPPAITSGIRIGTPIVTTRKMKEPEMVIISDLLSRVIDEPENSTEIKRVSGRVHELCKKFPVYEE
ncbi:MAG: serine hydroxymethyltransferase [Thermodesulfovibrionia bacterium]|nr:serine hydroxymethyltransferase [Thermodesulfovibrionia bacterium]